jgi:UDP:flavonoid glycosyltransferase YjiC (YdhE family)
VSAAIAQRWRLAQGVCTICEAEQEVVDTTLELADGVRVRVCGTCAQDLAVAHKIESKASAAVLAQAEREAAAQEAMLQARDTELAERARQIEALTGELERMREERERRSFALNRIVAAAQELL